MKLLTRKRSARPCRNAKDVRRVPDPPEGAEALAQISVPTEAQATSKNKHQALCELMHAGTPSLEAVVEYLSIQGLIAANLWASRRCLHNGPAGTSIERKLSTTNMCKKWNNKKIVLQESALDENDIHCRCARFNELLKNMSGHLLCLPTWIVPAHNASLHEISAGHMGLCPQNHDQVKPIVLRQMLRPIRRPTCAIITWSSATYSPTCIDRVHC